MFHLGGGKAYLKLLRKGSLWYYLGMRESEPEREINVDALFAKLESGRDPEDRYLAESLKEMFLSKAYLWTILPDTADKHGLMKAIRIVRIGDHIGELLSKVAGDERFSKRERSRIIKTFRSETNRLPVENLRIPMKQEQLALKTLKGAGLCTVASMVIGDTITGQKMIGVCYPKVFMNLDPSIPPSKRETFGLAIAMYFLKRVPVK